MPFVMGGNNNGSMKFSSKLINLYIVFYDIFNDGIEFLACWVLLSVFLNLNRDNRSLTVIMASRSLFEFPVAFFPQMKELILLLHLLIIKNKN